MPMTISYRPMNISYRLRTISFRSMTTSYRPRTIQIEYRFNNGGSTIPHINKGKPCKMSATNKYRKMSYYDIIFELYSACSQLQQLHLLSVQCSKHLGRCLQIVLYALRQMSLDSALSTQADVSRQCSKHIGRCLQIVL